jgi:hypothetical protein
MERAGWIYLGGEIDGERKNEAGTQTHTNIHTYTHTHIRTHTFETLTKKNRGKESQGENEGKATYRM